MGSLISKIFVRVIDWVRSGILSIQFLFGGGGRIEDDKCCSLARLDNECKYYGDKSRFSCPDGYYRQWWHCCEGTRLIGCGECTTSTEACWRGSFACSIWWWTTQRC
jgi:hypothetical protein